MKSKPLNKAKSASYNVENVIDLIIGEKNYKTTATYTILLKNQNYDFILDRGKLSINGNLPDTKFLSLADNYFSCLFPIHFEIKNDRISIKNFLEITNRINKKDKELKSIFSGDGIDYISNEFLKKTNSEEKLHDFISNLNLIKTLLFSIQKFKKIQYMSWNILPILNTFWEGYSTFDIEHNLLEFNGKIKISPDFIEQLHHFALDNYYDFDFKEIDVSSKLHHETKYINEDLKFTIATTHVNIKLPNFEYNEAFTLKSKTAN